MEQVDKLIFDGLNPAQYQAVSDIEGPQLIIAGAGSGKTRALTHRIAYLIDECQVMPWNIMAITFTNKAAREMRDRIQQMVPHKLSSTSANAICMGTFHVPFHLHPHTLLF